jgi:septum site-determining protein MinC
VVVLGDVNPGAEVIAGGDVIVWGHLRGIVHAGAMGDPERCVCALDLSPTQLRIGSHIARPPDEKRRRKESRPERAFIIDDQIIAECWR